MEESTHLSDAVVDVKVPPQQMGHVGRQVEAVLVRRFQNVGHEPVARGRERRRVDAGRQRVHCERARRRAVVDVGVQRTREHSGVGRAQARHVL